MRERRDSVLNYDTPGRDSVGTLVIRRLRVPLVGMTLLALVACGGAASSSSAAQGGSSTAGSAATGAPPDQGGGDTGGDFDLCTALTLDEVSAEAGVEVTESSSANSSGVASCNYLTADGSPVAGNTLSTSSAAIDAVQMFEANLAGEGAEQISGIGDRAVMVGSDSFPILWVLKGDTLFAMSVLAEDLDAAGKRDATTELARLAVGRLP